MYRRAHGKIVGYANRTGIGVCKMLRNVIFMLYEGFMWAIVVAILCIGGITVCGLFVFFVIAEVLFKAINSLLGD